MRKLIIIGVACICAFSFICCSGGNKKDIALKPGAAYLIAPSGKATIFPSADAPGAQNSKPLHRLRVKRQNEGPGAKNEGNWNCTDCICNGDECTCTECTSS